MLTVQEKVHISGVSQFPRVCRWTISSFFGLLRLWQDIQMEVISLFRRLIAGQGAWYALTHWSDLNLWAGNPISGYSSISAYVPYTLWQPLDGKKVLIRDIAMRSYDHALLAENAVPFKVHVRHGTDDGISLESKSDER
jgi:hypothetical protein